MGWFTYKCSKCNTNISNGGDEGMEQTLIVVTNGSLMKGNLDDYGRFYINEDTELSIYELEHFNIFHEKCWEDAGKPTVWNGKESCSTQ